MADKRITELTNERLILGDGDYAMVDSNEGTYKYKLKRILDAIPALDTTLTIAGRAADAKATGDALASVDVDTVNNARQLLSKKYLLDEEPYLFRASGGDGSDRVEECIVGGSVGWNQMCNAASVTVTNGHKYISKVGSTWTIGLSTGSAITGLTSGTDMVIDLTAMFGSTIADYIYSLEQATAGAGVAWFKKYFPEDYYEYCAPTLKHVEGVSQKEVVGWNQFDVVSANLMAGTYSGSALANNVHTEGYIPVLPSTTYHYRHDISPAEFYIRAYDSSKNGLGEFVSKYGAGTKDFDFTTPANARFIRAAWFNSNGVTVTEVANANVCISLSDPTKNGQYEPYKKNIYPLDSSLTLRGIPKLTDGKMYFDGDKYNADGTVQRRYGIVDLGTLNWSYVTNRTNPYFKAALPNFKVRSSNAGNTNVIIGNSYSLVTGTALLNTSSTDKAYNCGTWESSTDSIHVVDKSYTDAATFKSAMSGVYLVYELATPTTETADPYTALQTLDPNGTEEFVSAGIVPVGHYSKYLENLRSKIEGLPKDFSTLIAPTEKAYKATRNYTVGSLLIVDNILYKVTSAIANGGTITPNTNVTATTLAAVIAAL